MKTEGIKYRPFSLKLKSPFINSSGTITYRSGFIISLTDESGNISYGEISPLPGFSKESLEEAEQELIKISKFLYVSDQIEDLHSLSTLIDDYQLSPSVRFGIEQAVFSSLLKRDHSLLAKLSLRFQSEISVNAVIGLGSNSFSKIQGKVNSGYTTIKIKMGRDNFEDDLNLIKDIRLKLGENIKIRLDVNGKWSFEEARFHLDMLKPYNIEYIEEPCKGVENLVTLAGDSPVPVAIDESLQDINNAYSILESSPVLFLIIKPMITGGFSAVSELISQAALYNKNIIISSSFETPVGKNLLVFLASTVHHAYAHGLDTSGLFTGEITADPYEVIKGKIFFTSTSFPPSINMREL